MIPKLGLLAIAFFTSVSCGSTTRTVQYVYVDNPVYSPASSSTTTSSSSSSKTEYVNNTEALSRARQNNPDNNTERVYHNDIASNKTNVDYVDNSVKSSNTPQNDSPFTLANTYVYGAYRGFGEGESTSMTAAYKMATTRASQDVLEKIAIVIDSFTSDDVESINSAGMEGFKMEIKTYSRACVRNIKVVATKRTRGQMNRVEHCVEVSAEDVIESLSQILAKLNDADRKRVEEKIKKAEY